MQRPATIAFTQEDTPFSIAAGASLKQSVTIPGTEKETYEITSIYCKGDQNGRVHFDFTDQGEAITRKPVNWRVFDREWNVLPGPFRVSAGSQVDVTFYNDGAAAGTFSVTFAGVILK